ncbi:YesL family protein [Enterococcus dongliensis]|uniref:YesL family protein n=1 Tax=Enterococcus dongliensis TaxID=2559925 RepID=UPI0028917792|nr:YesL family protein [Enterococcus dongliensis]MDT2613487.1 YesL family protein [Enterococcus dongliensis]
MRTRGKEETVSIFDMDSRLTKSLSGLYSLFILNVLFIICCLPVVTIGIAQCSLYASILEIKNGNTQAPFVIYCDAVKKYGKKSFSLGLIELFGIGVFYLDWLIINLSHKNFSYNLKVLYFGIGILLLVTLFHAIPMSLGYKKSLKHLIKESFIAASLNLVPSFILLAGAFVLSILFNISVLVTMALFSFFLVIGFSWVTYFHVLLIEQNNKYKNES